MSHRYHDVAYESASGLTLLVNRKVSIIFVICLSILVLSAPAWGRSIVTGRVVDAETGNPIENAAVFIKWTKPGPGPPGLAGTIRLEVAETLTDADGPFKVPRYSTLFWGKEYSMFVYKKGHVCWSSRKIFPTYEERKDFKLKNGMVIKLERFKEEYSKEKHASFTLDWSVGRKMPGLFDDAIKSEIELEREMLRRNRKK
jgi:hypothetical protein